jgi:hypothetical protein
VNPSAAAKENTNNSKIQMDPSFRWDDERGMTSTIETSTIKMDPIFRWDDEKWRAYGGNDETAPIDGGWRCGRG